MIKWVLAICAILMISCRQKQEISTLPKAQDKAFNDSDYVKNTSFKEGDVRRYGLYPEIKTNPKILNDIMYLAQQGIVIHFPKGYYPINLDFRGVSKIEMDFEDVTLGGSLSITENEGVPSSGIILTGNLKVLDKVFIRKSNNIFLDTIKVMSDTVSNLYNKKNRGVSIYVGSKDIKFKKLEIQDTGGSHDDFYKYTAAALQIHGWNNNPERIVIDELIINNASRTALYLTGNEHFFNIVSIDHFGFGEVQGMFGLDDAVTGTEKEFAGVWINKCNDCVIDSLNVSNDTSKIYSLKMGIGVYSRPTFILNLKRRNLAKQSPIEDDILTNVLVKHEY